MLKAGIYGKYLVLKEKQTEFPKRKIFRISSDSNK